MPSEPFATAILLVTFGFLLATSIVFARASQWISVPVPLLFLCIGMLAGSEGIGGIAFEDYAFSFRLGTVAIILILFDGGLNTPTAAVRRTIGPAGVLATFGVLGTAAIVAGAARLLGFAWPEALLFGAIVSSTDAAAVFAVLRGSGIHLKRRLGATLEVESGINDPMAFMLTVLLTENLLTPGSVSGVRAALDVVMQIGIGAALGLGIGFAARRVLTRLPLAAGGLYPAFSLAVAFLAYAIPTLIHGSGFLAVYLAAIVLGNGPLPYRTGVVRVHDALAWLSQITMFLILGLLVFPSQLLDTGWTGLALAAVLAFIARPFATALCLLPFRYPPAEVAYIGWVGLRGAVPIVFATYPVLARAPGAEWIFAVVFFVVVFNSLIPGSTVAWVTRKLGLEHPEPPAPPAVLSIESRQPLEGDLLSFYIDEGLAVTGVLLADLTLPEGASVAMIIRGKAMIAPSGNTVLTAGDHVYIVSKSEDRGLIQLLFGVPEEDA
jgi:cell volume regulation protein A